MVIWFSGTGNSRAVAEELGRLTGGETISLPSVIASGGNVSVPSGDNDVIWVFPVHSWGVPEVVRQMIHDIDITGNNLTHHLVATCGDDCGYTDRMWRHDMEQKGWSTGGAYTVIMPNTYVTFPFFDVDTPEVRDRKLSAMNDRIATIARDIMERQNHTDVRHGSFPSLKTGVVYPFFMRHLIRPDKFKVSDSCISCGKCAGICPLNNITLDRDRKPYWGKRCCTCLACYHICPSRAISYGSLTKGKGQYYFGINDRKR